MSTTKKCAHCNFEKLLEDFHKQPSGKLGRHSWCKQCFNGKKRVRAPRPPDERRANNIYTRYKLRESDFDLMLERQHGKCAICEASFDTAKIRIDHNHETGEVRGLLCQRCNMLCAALDDDAFFHRALRYVGKES